MRQTDEERRCARPGPKLGLGLGWRRELALAIERRHDLGFIELLADDFLDSASAPPELVSLRRRGVKVVLHSVSLSLGTPGPVDGRRVGRLARLADRVGAELVTDHACFVRAGGVESGHLLPVPRTAVALEVLQENVSQVMRALPAPFAVENIAALVEWPGPELSEAELLAQLCRQTGCGLLLDVANLYASARNHGWDLAASLKTLPLERLAYVHLAGGVARRGLYHDTHAHPVPSGVMRLLSQVAERATLPGAMVERDDHFPSRVDLVAELDAVAAVLTSSALEAAS